MSAILDGYSAIDGSLTLSPSSPPPGEQSNSGSSSLENALLALERQLDDAHARGVSDAEYLTVFDRHLEQYDLATRRALVAFAMKRIRERQER
jgi:hypothetical protein